jgi:hypothetical protein
LVRIRTTARSNLICCLPNPYLSLVFGLLPKNFSAPLNFWRALQRLQLHSLVLRQILLVFEDYQMPREVVNACHKSPFIR